MLRPFVFATVGKRRRTDEEVAAAEFLAQDAVEGRARLGELGRVGVVVEGAEVRDYVLPAAVVVYGACGV